jgi:23S rRNA (cytosine1962-C5)-methyltransferase
MAAGLILFEDEHLLVANKPAGINTHKPDRFAPDGLHEWLTKRGRRLSIIHRLDKETSGVLVFGKTARVNQSLSRQFESQTVRKQYLLLSARRPTRKKFRAESAGEATEFEYLQPHAGAHLIAARPLTGKTHQIRRHAADNGFPILGDTKYGGAPAPRLMLHAHRISLEEGTFEASVPAAFQDMDAFEAAKEFRDILFDEDTNAFRLISGAADGFADVVVDWYAGDALVQWQTERVFPEFYEKLHAHTVYEQIVTKQKRTAPTRVSCSGGSVNRQALPDQRFTEAPLQPLIVRENGLRFLVKFGEGLATGIFLDQRENRWRLMQMPLAGKTVLNCFAYTCAFSIAAATAGANTTSIDLSQNYLDWGKENFRLNGLDPAAHQCIAGDVFGWLRRFEKRATKFDVILLDPPTFSTTKRGRVFRAARDYLELETMAIRLLAPGGVLFASTNQRTLAAGEFEKTLCEAVRVRGRAIQSLDFETLPFDFRVAEGERPHLKTFWTRLA